MPRKNKTPDTETDHFVAELQERVARGEDFESAFNAIDQAEQKEVQAAVRRQKHKSRETIRRYHDILRMYGFDRRAMEGQRIIYSASSLPDDVVRLTLMSETEIDWAYVSPKAQMPVLGKDPPSLQRTLSYYHKRIIELGPISQVDKP